MGIFQGLQNLPELFKKNLNLVETEFLLDQLPTAALLIDPGKGCVLLANNGATSLSHYTRAELHEMGLPQIFPQLETGGSLQELSASGGEREIVLRQRGGDFTDVIIKPGSLSPETRYILITMESAANRAHRAAEAEHQAKLWEAVHLLVLSTHTTDMPKAFAAALEGGEFLSGGDILAVYQLLAHEPGLLSYAMRGNPAILPEHVKTINMSHLRKTELWVPGKHPASVLQRIAKAADLKYLLTIPLGDNQGLLGLLVIGSTQYPPIDQLKPAAQIIAAAISSTLQKNILTTNLRDRLHVQETALALGSATQGSVEDGVVVLSTKLRILELNQAAEQILGYATPEVKSQPVHNIMIGTSSLEPALRSAQEGIPTHNIGNTRLHRRNGEAFEARVRTLPVKVDGKVARVLIIFQDLSEHENLRITTQQLEQRALLGDVMAIFAHEVKNPINNITSGLQLMAHMLEEGDPKQENIQRMLDDCKRLDHQMRSVLDFSRNSEYKPVAVDLLALVQRLFEKWRPHMARENVKPLLQIEPETPPVLVDQRALEQVFTNLISNAVQAMSKAGGTLAIKAQVQEKARERPQLHISISDTGPGIPKENLEKIFRPFYTTNPEGTGLGLAITRRILIAHKGNISVDSFPGGTVFTIQLPLANGYAELNPGGTE